MIHDLQKNFETGLSAMYWQFVSQCDWGNIDESLSNRIVKVVVTQTYIDMLRVCGHDVGSIESSRAPELPSNTLCPELNSSISGMMGMVSCKAVGRPLYSASVVACNRSLNAHMIGHAT